jgi:ABC-type transport system involved in cytochrome c biogenesis permease subunit
MLDESLYLGWILFTWAMIAGSIWAYLAWGSYWTWNAKGIWSYLLWFYYAGVIHVRSRAAWQGWRLDALALVGFAAVLFTYLGLGLVLKSNHPLL